VVAAADAPGSSVEFPVVVLELELPKVDELPNVDELPKVDELLAGGPPMAVVPVDGDVFVVLPGAVGPASALDVEPLDGPTLVVPGVGLVDAMLLLPSVDEPVADEAVALLPQGAASGTPVVCAIAATVQAASAAIANRFMKSLREMKSRVGRAYGLRVQLNQ
jgi:hypothetical protein